MADRINEIIAKLGLADFSTIELLQTYAGILNELKAREVIRTRNNPIADYSEWLVASKLNLKLEGNSSFGYDAIDSEGTRIQIKSRRITPDHKSVRSSAIRNLSQRPFDIIIGIVFYEDFSIDYVLKVPYEIVLKFARYNEHTNSHIFYLRKSLLETAGVEDLTSLFI